MRVSHSTEAIVLRAFPYGDSDKIVSFLTENHGKISGIAKGAKRSRKRFANSLEPFSVVELRFQERQHSNLAFLLAADLRYAFKNLTANLQAIAAASYLIEITDRLIGEGDDSRQVFHHLKEGLGVLENIGYSVLFLTSFELKLLKLAGYEPALNRCRQCAVDRPKDRPADGWHFSPSDGGVFCYGCSKFQHEILPVGSKALAALADLQKEEQYTSGRISPSSSVVKEIRSLVLRFIQFQVGREIKSASFLNHVCMG
ncbi:MAG TPA: DNA repair protein RecO [Candidatus Binatia bacterium]|jgi:DNA repair protein RecO (recombination protein O)